MKKTILGCAVAAALLNAGHTAAGGLWLNEYGDFSGGRASAGSAAGLDDAASIMYNPASGQEHEYIELHNIGDTNGPRRLQQRSDISAGGGGNTGGLHASSEFPGGSAVTSASMRPRSNDNDMVRRAGHTSVPAPLS